LGETNGYLPGRQNLNFRDLDMHTIQYALVGPRCIFVGNTENMTDGEIRQKLCNQLLLNGNDDIVERYDRCCECEEWTTVRGKLRPDSNCPAVQEALKKGVK
jgi:hypothetical protein